jgi:hypothetical protein
MMNRPTKEALELAGKLDDIADRLSIIVRNLRNPAAHGPSADTMTGLASRLLDEAANWEAARLYRKTEPFPGEDDPRAQCDYP